MEVEQVAVGELVEHPDNPRQGDVGAIVESIRTNGWYGTVVAQRDSRHVLVGNHRLQAARELGMESVPVMWVDVDDATALRILLADNRTSDLAAYDDAALAGLLTDLAQQTEEALSGTGYDGDFLDTLLADLSTAVRPRRDAIPPEQRKEQQYDVSPIRQIILVLDPVTFRRALSIMSEMRRRDSLAYPTNTDVVMTLLDREATAMGFDPGAMPEAEAIAAGYDRDDGE